MSASLPVVPVTGLTREGLVEAADTALYRAKSAGRNRAELSDPMLLPKPEATHMPANLGAHLVEE